VKRSAREARSAGAPFARIRSAFEAAFAFRHREPAAEKVPTTANRPPPVPREWNLWDLERRAREPGGYAIRDAEWAALFIHLREFASAEGTLPKEFDELVRQSFAELIQAA
jgi:hypothetical protein